MKLSEAIRKGCEMVPQQAFNRFHVTTDFGTIECCALGAAYIGMRNQPQVGDYGNSIYEWLDQWFNLERPAVAWWRAPHDQDKTLGYVITRLNDRFRWPREQIADWLEGQGL